MRPPKPLQAGGRGAHSGAGTFGAGRCASSSCGLLASRPPCLGRSSRLLRGFAAPPPCQPPHAGGAAGVCPLASSASLNRPSSPSPPRAPLPPACSRFGGRATGAEGQPPAGRAWGCAPPKPARGTAPQQPPRQHTAEGGGRRRTAAHGGGRRTAAADGGTLRLMERRTAAADGGGGRLTAERTAAADSGTADRPTLPTVPPNGGFGGQSAQTAPAAPCQPLPPQLHPCPPEPRNGGGGAKNGQKMDFSGLAAAARPPDRRTRHAAQTPFWSYFVPKGLRWTAHFLPFGRGCTPL